VGAPPSRPLRAVPAPGAEAPPERAEPAAGGFPGGGAQRLLIALTLLLGLGLVWQLREGQRLASRVELLEGELSQARSELAAQRQERAQVRERLGVVRGQIEALETLLAEPPTP
jgi:hypothetical protein